MSAFDTLDHKIDQLERELEERAKKMDVLLEDSRKAIDTAMHAYKLDSFGYLWTYHAETQKYLRTNMRVASPEIINRAIKTKHIADFAVTEEKLDENSVTERTIADDAVTERTIADDAVTSDKIAPGSVRSRHLADDTIEDLSGLIEDFKEWVIDTLKERKPIVTYGESNFDRTCFLYEEAGIIACDKDNLLYLIEDFDGAKFTFSRHATNGDIMRVFLTSQGWSSGHNLYIATGRVHMDIEEDGVLMDTDFDEEVENS